MFSLGLLLGLGSSYISEFIKKFKNKDKRSTMKILFILRARDKDFSGNEGEYSYSGGFSSGLNNSVMFIHKMLSDIGIESKIVEVIDSNGVDKEVYQYKPTHVICEAIWVEPKKFKELKKLHPKVQWFIRLHSDLPFLATEGHAIKYIGEYIEHDVTITANSPRMVEALSALYPYNNIPYLPNYYPIQRYKTHQMHNGETINVGCFGAIRILKNQLQQAVAAIMFAIKHNKKLRFHINASRVENNSQPALKNIVELFKQFEDYGFELVSHGWKSHDNFLKLVGEMNISMQMSYNETCNIVSLDAASELVPVVGSNEIPWLPKKYHADPNDINSIIHMMERVLECPMQVAEDNLEAIAYYNEHTLRAWKKFLNIE